MGRMVALGTAPPSSRWRRPFEEGDHETLVRIVKEAQARKFVGTCGDFGEFLRMAGHANGTRTDPRRYSWEVLKGFLETLEEERAVVCINRHQKYADVKGKSTDESSEDPTARSYPAGVVWDLVRRTEAHPCFQNKYNFPAYAKGWKRSWTNPEKLPKRPKLLAMDCEMCETEKSNKALLSVSLVDEKGTLLYHTLVKPKAKIIDYRSELTGITEEEMKEVKVSRAEASRRVRSFLKEGAVLIGHSLNHDLQALRIDYRPVIDTSLIFRYEGLSMALPSLEVLSSRLLHRQLRTDKKHNSTDDAKATIELVLLELERDGNATPPLKAPEIKIEKDELKKLLVHSLPTGFDLQLLRHLFRSNTGPAPMQFEKCRQNTAFAIFKSAEDANLAFKNLPGVLGSDYCGRPQKQNVVIQGASNGRRWGKLEVAVRKMAAHNGMMYGQDIKNAKRKRKSNNRRNGSLGSFPQS